MAVLNQLAIVDTRLSVVGAPSCWVPMLVYLGHEVTSCDPKIGVEGWEFEHVDWRSVFDGADDKRRAVELASVARPELCDSLYKLTTSWGLQRIKRDDRQSFLVTCNGSFFRPEVQEYRERLRQYLPSKRKAVIVPCSADKPYPSGFHSALKDRIDDDWYLLIATGVLGVVPEELFGDMPLYDSGVPNERRVEDTVEWYFNVHAHDAVVVASDFYARSVRVGLVAAGFNIKKAKFVFGSYYRDTYENTALIECADRVQSFTRNFR